MSEAVLDAGPLIHLAELGALDALKGFSTLYLPKTVVEEVQKYQPAVFSTADLIFNIVPSPNLTAGLLTIGQALLLDRGEIDALGLIQLHPDAILLTDDSVARLAAEQMGYKVHGTIGLLIRMVRKGYRKPDEVLDLFVLIPIRSSLHIKPALLSDVVQRLKKEWGSSK